MKKSPFLVFGLLLIFSCSKEDASEIVEADVDIKKTQRLLSVSEVNSFIEKQLKTRGDMDWTNSPANVLWSAVVHGDNILSVGYGEKGESFSLEKSLSLTSAKENVFTIVSNSEGIQKSKVQLKEDKVLNFLDIKVTKLETIIALQKTDKIRYLEPIGYSSYLELSDSEQQKSNTGCNKGGNSINGNDYRIIAPNSWLPWNYGLHRITEAWNYSTGRGVTVGVVDTGLSQAQYFFNEGFNDGWSAGRTVERYGTFIDSPWIWAEGTDGVDDKCGHGTSMSAAIAAPRGNDFHPMGVAYNCNLVSYRGTQDVVIDDYHEKKGVSEALIALANRSDVKIISMSVGFPWSIGNVADAVRYAYSRGKLVIAAGGTSTNFTNWYGVIFPANMNETVAVTGIMDNGYNSCVTCHDGDKIDFTVIMQRSGDTGRDVPVLGYYTGDRKSVGGSSIATATVAGIAALVWGTHPSLSRDQVLDRMKRAGDFYPNRNNKFGYGNINALRAVQ